MPAVRKPADPGTVLVAVDFAPPSRQALAKAIDLAERLGARLEVVHAVPRTRPVLPFSRENRAASAAIRRDEIARAAAQLKRWCPARPGLRCRTRVLSGEPAGAILAHAKRVHADWIVVGNLGHGSWHEILLGSTAERVLRHATVPVLLVPSEPPRRSRAR